MGLENNLLNSYLSDDSSSSESASSLDGDLDYILELEDDSCLKSMLMSMKTKNVNCYFVLFLR